MPLAFVGPVVSSLFIVSISNKLNHQVEVTRFFLLFGTFAKVDDVYCRVGFQMKLSPKIFYVIPDPINETMQNVLVLTVFGQKQ